MKKMFQHIINLFKTKKECKHDEVCPIYLAYLDKYNDNSKEIKYCKNPNKQYCTKYNLINQSTWKTLSKEEKIKLIRDMDLINFIDK
jgi:hypothetical protein